MGMVRGRDWDAWLNVAAQRAGCWAGEHWLVILAAAWGGIVLLAAVAPLALTAGLHPLADFLYWMFRFICHQEPARSLWIAGHPMAICARDVGLYSGLGVGLLASKHWKLAPPGWLVVLCVLPMALDGGTQLLGLRESTNILRLITGGLAGVPAAMYLIPRAGGFAGRRTTALSLGSGGHG